MLILGDFAGCEGSRREHDGAAGRSRGRGRGRGVVGGVGCRWRVTWRPVALSIVEFFCRGSTARRRKADNKRALILATPVLRTRSAVAQPPRFPPRAPAAPRPRSHSVVAQRDRPGELMASPRFQMKVTEKAICHKNNEFTGVLDTWYVHNR